MYTQSQFVTQISILYRNFKCNSNLQKLSYNTLLGEVSLEDYLSMKCIFGIFDHLLLSYTQNGDKMALFLRENLPICSRLRYSITIVFTINMIFWKQWLHVLCKFVRNTSLTDVVFQQVSIIWKKRFNCNFNFFFDLSFCKV